MSGDSDIIDLTDSFTLIDHCQLANLVIELDDSLSNSSLPRPARRQASLATKERTKLTKSENVPPHSPKNKEKNSKGIGDCPVCWDELGKNPLASTKCGHVFCLHCLEQVVKQTKRCPTCRCILKKTSDYHPIYLSLQ